jgi:hypothetical protein
VSSPATPPLDLDQVASTLAGLWSGWTGQGLTAGPLTWRDARASWPRPLLTDRSMIAEPQSVGLTVTTADGRTGRLVIWRGGWADIDLLDGGTVTSRNPAIHSLADCIAEARSLASQLTAPPPPDRHPSDLAAVTVLWVSDWSDGPVEGMASYQGEGLLVSGDLRRRGRRMDLTPPMPALRAGRRRAPAAVGQPLPLGRPGRRQLLLSRPRSQLRPQARLAGLLPR